MGSTLNPKECWCQNGRSCRLWR
uniref:Uncharacterized protein n=1 Tax=Rhizophora mucronata TaxID=61149 RepID=A0A2P2LFH9_RHIMU